jgi:DNA-binding transcriptional LysR family regulator
VRVLPEWEGEPTKLHFLYPSRKSATPAARAFMDFFSERLAAVEPWSAGR